MVDFHLRAEHAVLVITVEGKVSMKYQFNVSVQRYQFKGINSMSLSRNHICHSQPVHCPKSVIWPHLTSGEWEVKCYHGPRKRGTQTWSDILAN